MATERQATYEELRGMRIDAINQAVDYYRKRVESRGGIWTDDDSEYMYFEVTQVFNMAYDGDDDMDQDFNKPLKKAYEAWRQARYEQRWFCSQCEQRVEEGDRCSCDSRYCWDCCAAVIHDEEMSRA